MSEAIVDKKNRYFSVIGGTFRTQVPKDHPDAVERFWESADKSKSGVKFEQIFNRMRGLVRDIQFHKGEYGENINIVLDENAAGETPVISLGTSSREGEDFLKKAPNIDFSKEVMVRPFSFNGTEGDEVRGIEVVQTDAEGKFTVKVKNYFRDEVAKININGYPNAENYDDMDSDSWKVFFIQARKFLVKYTQDNVCPKLTNKVMITTAAPAVMSSMDAAIDELYGAPTATTEPNPDDIPF